MSGRVALLTEVRLVDCFAPRAYPGDPDAKPRYGLSVPCAALRPYDWRLYRMQLPSRRDAMWARMSSPKPPVVSEAHDRWEALGRIWRRCEWANVPRDRLLQGATASVLAEWTEIRHPRFGVRWFMRLRAASFDADELADRLEALADGAEEEEWLS